MIVLPIIGTICRVFKEKVYLNTKETWIQNDFVSLESKMLNLAARMLLRDKFLAKVSQA